VSTSRHLHAAFHVSHIDTLQWSAYAGAAVVVAAANGSDTVRGGVAVSTRIVSRIALPMAVVLGCGPSDGENVDAVQRAGTVAIEDFGDGVVAANHPEGAGVPGVWYDATNDAFATPSASTLDGAAAMRIDDGGFTNGVYAIYAGAIPETGTYRLRVPIAIVEATATATDAIDAYEVGVAVGAGAVHRGPNPSDLDPPSAATGQVPGLTVGDDTGLGTQIVETAEFDATAGDDLLIAFGTDVHTGDWSANAGAWAGGYILVGAIELVSVDPPDTSLVIDNDDGAPDYTVAGAWTVSGGVGYAGGTYAFSSAGNAASATWTRSVPAGFYEVEAIYRSGANRSASAMYSIDVAGEEVLTKALDQRYLDLSWRKLGLIEVPEEAEVSVTLDAATSQVPGVVIADAVRLVPSDGPPPIDPPELRLAALTVFDDIDDVGALQATIDQLADLHYNAVAVHTRYRGDATYVPNKSDGTYPNSEPRNAQAGDVDVLEEVTTRGHAAGLAVFAYVNTHLVTSSVDVIADPQHVVNTHPEWRTWAYNGGMPVVQETLDDPEGLWLEPALPEVREYNADIVGDIALNYDIDGVILDRIRYPQTNFTRETGDFGYHPDAVSAFNDEYDKEGVPDPYDPDWIEFRQRAITDNVDAIYRRLTDIDDQLVLLAYPIGRFDDAIEYNYQDWPEWLRGRHIDGVLPQIYTADNVSFAARLDQHAAAYGGDRLLGVTIDAFSPGIDVAGQIELSRVAGLDGTSPFRHGTMGALGYLEDLESAYDGIAELPAMPWKGASIAKLKLRALCSDAPNVERRWRIRNPNAWSIEATYWLLDSMQNGNYFAPPGDSFVVTQTKSGANIVVLTWYDHEGRLRLAIDLSLGLPCDWWS
jgi:uncharacterized lipoprotein YddW (UPF0748 family)